jgi:glycosyltransferase involved in cell wall biosynthesis
MARVAVVLPVYNHERYLQQTLESIYSQDYSDYQIVAIDDGSADSSLKILNKNHARITLIEAGGHRGAAAARNTAIRAVDSEFVAFIDADDVWTPERLRQSVERFQNGNVDLVASALSFIDTNGKELPGIWACPPDAANDYWGALLDRNWIGTPSVTVRRKTLDEVGCFDETFTHSEDYDLWLRAGQDHAIDYIHTPLVQCRRHSSNTSLNITLHHKFERTALQKVDPARAHAAFYRLYAASDRRAEAWIWFLLRSASSGFPEEIHSALESHPESPSLRFALGIFQADKGDYEKALTTFRELKDRDAASLHNLAVLLALCGNSTAALPYLHLSLRFRPDYYDARYNIAAIREGRELRLTRRPFRQQVIAMIGALKPERGCADKTIGCN